MHVGVQPKSLPFRMQQMQCGSHDHRPAESVRRVRVEVKLFFFRSLCYDARPFFFRAPE
jgi:hypothetical protein